VAWLGVTAKTVTPDAPTLQVTNHTRRNRLAYFAPADTLPLCHWHQHSCCKLDCMSLCTSSSKLLWRVPQHLCAQALSAPVLLLSLARQPAAVHWHWPATSQHSTSIHNALCSELLTHCPTTQSPSLQLCHCSCVTAAVSLQQIPYPCPHKKVCKANTAQ
jgi:hypothetical protein